MTTPSFLNAGAWAAVINSASSMTIPLPSGRVVGNVLIAHTSIVSTRNPSWSAGWTPIGAGNECAYRVIDGTETAPTVSFTSGANQAGIILQYQNTSGVGAVREAQSNSTTTLSISGITTTVAGSLVVALLGVSGLTGPGTPTGYTNDLSTQSTVTTSWSLNAASVVEASSGTTSPSISETVAVAIWRADLIELKPAAATGGLIRSRGLAGGFRQMRGGLQ